MVKTLSSLKNVLKEAKKELKKLDQVRENAQDNMRKALRFSKQSILLIHQKKIQDAKKMIKTAREIIRELQKGSQEYPEIIFGASLFKAALQEYSEANILLGLVEESRFTDPKEIGVPPADYVLGLADVVGEYRRQALDALREGDIQKGGECLEIMDEIFIELMALDEAYMLVPGLRRKCDITRRIIENTRGDITQEIRRESLKDFLRGFEKRLQTNKG